MGKIIYLICALFLEFSYLNLVIPNLNSHVQVLLEGEGYLNGKNGFISFEAKPQENLFLRIAFINPGDIASPLVVLNSNKNQVRIYKSVKNRLIQTDYFNIPLDFVKNGNNELYFEFKEMYPDKITSELKNYLYKAPSGNLAVYYNAKKAGPELLSNDSFFRIPLFLLLFLIVIPRFKKREKYIFVASLVSIFLVILFLPLYTPLMLKISPLYFGKLIVFWVYIIIAFHLVRLFRANFKDRLALVFLISLFLLLGFTWIELIQISSKIAAFTDILILVGAIRILKGFYNSFEFYGT